MIGEHLIDDVKLETAKTGETISIPLKLTNLLEENTEYTLISSSRLNRTLLWFYFFMPFSLNMSITFAFLFLYLCN